MIWIACAGVWWLIIEAWNGPPELILERAGMIVFFMVLGRVFRLMFTHYLPWR